MNRGLLGSITARVGRVVAGGGAAIFLLHLTYVALGIVLFAPLLSGLGRLVMHLAARQIVADMDIVWFLISPFGSLVLVVFAALLTTIVIFEQASMMSAVLAVASRVPVRLPEILAWTAAQSVAVLSFSVHLILRLLAICLPFIGIAAAAAWMLLSDYDINYYLSVRPPGFYVCAAIIGAAMLAMALVLIDRLLSWSLALPLVLFDGEPPASSFARSGSRVRGNKRLVAACFMLWAVIAALLGSVLFGAIRVLGTMLVPPLAGSLGTLLPVLGFLVILWSLGNFAVTAVGSGSFAALLVELFHRLAGPAPQPDYEQTANTGRLRPTTPILVGMLTAAALASLLTGYWLVKSIAAPDLVTIVAHRGAAGRAPENTIAAVEAAIDDGADWIEIDVQETVDGAVIVFHDSDFMKLAGNSLKVWDATLAHVKRIDVGSWFAPEFSAERVPTLEEVLEAARGRARVVIELKYYGHDDQLESRVVDIVEQAGMVEDTAVMSLKLAGVETIRELRPQWQVGLLSAQVLGDLRRLDVDFLAVNQAMATPLFIRSNRKAGKRVFVWTVNDAVAMFTMMSRGVDGIITDEPKLARRVMAERADLSPVERLLIQTALLLGGTIPERPRRDESP